MTKYNEEFSARRSKSTTFQTLCSFVIISKHHYSSSQHNQLLKNVYCQKYLNVLVTHVNFIPNLEVPRKLGQKYSSYLLIYRNSNDMVVYSDAFRHFFRNEIKVTQLSIPTHAQRQCY